MMYISIRIKRILRYLAMDFFRFIFSWRWIVGILGVVGTLLIAALEGIALNTNVLYVFSIVLYGMPSILTLVFCAFPYSACFCEDYEDRYIQLEVIRGDLHSYTYSKVVVIFISSVMTMAIGIMMYAGILRGFLPWITIGDSHYENISLCGGLRRVFISGNYLLYYFLFGIQFGVIAGVLALLASYISLFISNRLLILSIPILGFYFIDYVRGMLFGVNSPSLYMVFNASNNIWDNDIVSYFMAVSIGIIGVILLHVLIYKRLKRRMRNE